MRTTPLRGAVSIARRFSSSSALWSSPSNTGVPGISSTRARTRRLPIRTLSQPQPPALTRVDGPVVVISPLSARVARPVTSCRIRSRLSSSSPSFPIRLSNASSTSVGSSAFTAYVSGRTFETVNPSTMEKLGEVPAATEQDVDRAVQAAEHGFRDWSRMPVKERAAALCRLADRITTEADELALMDALDSGNAITAS